MRHADPVAEVGPDEALALGHRLQDLGGRQRQRRGRDPLERRPHRRHRRVRLDVELHPIRAERVRQPDRLLVLELVADGADQLLHHVFQGDEAGPLATLVGDQRHVDAAPLHLREQRLERRALGGRQERPRQGLQVGRVVGIADHQILHVDEARRSGRLRGQERIAREMRALDHLQVLGPRQTGVEGADLRPLSHGVPHGQRAQVEDVLHEDQPPERHHPALLRLVEDDAQLLLARLLAARRGAEADQAQDSVRASGQEP